MSSDAPQTIADLQDDVLYLVGEVADLARLSSRTLRDLITEAHVPIVRLGGERSRLIRIRGDVARRLLGGEYSRWATSPPTAVPAAVRQPDPVHYTDPVRRRRRRTSAA